MDIEEYTEVDQQNLDESIANADVQTKYRLAGDIVNQALRLVASQCVPGKRVVELCHLGDSFIEFLTSRVYTKKVDGEVVHRGVASPTCINVNSVICNFSPGSASDMHTLSEGDLIKIDLGVHIDGYAAVGSHAFSLTENGQAHGRAADALAASFTASECLLRLMEPGTTNSTITEMLGVVAKEFNCNPVGGRYSFQNHRYTLEGEKQIESSFDADEKAPEVEIEMNEVYNVEVSMSTGLGKMSLAEDYTSVFHKDQDRVFQLRIKKARVLLSELAIKNPVFPFSSRLYDTPQHKFGIRDCVNNGHLIPHHVWREKKGEFVAVTRFTVLVTPSGPVRLTGLPVDPASLNTEFSIQNQDVMKLMNQPVKQGKSAKKSNKKKPQQLEQQYQTNITEFEQAFELLPVPTPAVAKKSGSSSIMMTDW